MALLKKYRALVDDGVIAPDPAQSIVAERLDALARRLRKWRRRSGLSALLLGRQPAPKGMYLFGPVGRGKTMLMDLFFQTTTFRPKRRVHFHEFMAEVHDRIAAARKSVPGDPIPRVARELAAKAALLCFDEMHVTDIADAMILGRLFKGLFENQVVVVATSNVPPSELYKNGLNRQLFLPFIELIEQHMQVEELQAAKDFTLAELCEQPLGTLDYLHIARRFHTVLIDGVPVLKPAQRDVARRFVNLVDTLYDARVSLIASAAAEPAELYPAGDVQFLFERTASRLTEMRSEGYLAGRKDRVNVAASA